LREYLSRIESFVEGVFRDLRVIINGHTSVNDYDYPSIKRVCDFFYSHTLYPVKGRAAFRILEGIIIGLFNLQNEGLESIREAREETQDLI